MRVLLLLNQYSEPQSCGTLSAMDFIVVYGETFGISKCDLNGENPYKFSEFASRKTKVLNALKELVLSGYVQPIQKSDSIVYCITKAGTDFCSGLNSEYSVDYSNTAKNAIPRYGNQSEKTIQTTINKHSMQSIRREQNE